FTIPEAKSTPGYIYVGRSLYTPRPRRQCGDGNPPLILAARILNLSLSEPCDGQAPCRTRAARRKWSGAEDHGPRLSCGRQRNGGSVGRLCRVHFGTRAGAVCEQSRGTGAL